MAEHHWRANWKAIAKRFRSQYLLYHRYWMRAEDKCENLHDELARSQSAFDGMCEQAEMLRRDLKEANEEIARLKGVTK